MQRSIISDTSCLILLEKIEEIKLLHLLFGEVIITSDIADEFDKSLPAWIKINNPIDRNYQNILESLVGKGEASAIALAVEQPDCLLILDDLKARNLAGELKINFSGTLGILVEGKLSGHINSMKIVLEKIKKTNFRITPALEKKILIRSEEL